MLIEIWRSLAEGPPIDEQRALRRPENKTSPNQPKAGTSRAAADDSDSDRDPYDTVPAQYGPSDDPYADLEDDYEDDW